MKICSVGAKVLHADGWTDRWTDMTKLIVAYAILIVHLKMASYCLPIRKNCTQQKKMVTFSLDHSTQGKMGH